jgi:hypothetical protein
MSASPERPSVRTIVRRHKAATAGAIAVVLVLLGAMVAAALPSAKAGALTDSSTCSAWSSATQAQRSAYAHLYITEHGSSVSGGLGAANVESTINGDCNHAAYLGEADDISIVAALNHAF